MSFILKSIGSTGLIYEKNKGQIKTKIKLKMLREKLMFVNLYYHESKS